LLYGQKEREINKEQSAFLDDHIWRITMPSEYNDDYYDGCYLCVKFGPSIDDWDCWDDRAANYEYAEDFWHMIESPWERMPGAWAD
jgi:hypothetical protein